MVDDLYYGSTCPCCAGIQDANLNISFDEDMLAEVLEEIYNEKVKPAEGEIPRKYYEANRDKFEEATAQGMAQSQNPNIADDKEFLKKYRHSIDVFSAFRSHAYAKRLADELYDSEGKLRPFEEWRKATESIQSHFNKNWLQTEYNTAVLRAEQAADWRHFEDNKEDFPCLKWMPTSSATPREQHKAFWDMGLTLPVDDKFWDKHHPGDLWNCKCYLEPTTAEPTPKKRIPKEKDAPKPAKGLESNPGKKAEMYSRNHPYYPQPQTCIWLKLAKGGAEARFGRFFNAEGVKCPGDCNKCQVPEKTTGDNCWRSFKEGEGVIKIHRLVKEEDSDFEKLLTVAKYFARKGNVVKLAPKMCRPPKFEYAKIYGDLIETAYKDKCPDLNINGIWYEHEGFITRDPKRALKNMLNDGLKQSSRLIIDQPDLSDAYIKRNIYNRVEKEGQIINEVWIKKGNQIRLLYKKSGESA